MQYSRVLDADGESEVQQQAGAGQGGACSMVVPWGPGACWMLVVVPEACRLTVPAFSWQPSDACREARLGVQQKTGGVPQGLNSIGIAFIGDLSLCLAWDSDSFAPTCWAVL